MAIARKNERTPLDKFKGAVRRNPAWPVVLCEGDSWFGYPGTNIPLEIGRLARFQLVALNLQDVGHEITEMLAGAQRRKIRERLETYEFDIILFSGGGNDIVGDEFIHFLHEAKKGQTWTDWINRERFDRRMQQIRNCYLDLIALRNDGKNPDCPILVHGYDRPIPSDIPFELLGLFRLTGPWMQPSLLQRKIRRREDQVQIAGWCIDQFNEMLRVLARDHAGFHYIPTVGTLSANDWANEIHPTSEGFKKLAAKYLEPLERLLPGKFRPLAEEPAPEAGAAGPQRRSRTKGVRVRSGRTSHPA